MNRCPLCNTQLRGKDERCKNHEACRKRIATRTMRTVSRMATNPFLGFNPEEAYREAPKGR